MALPQKSIEAPALFGSSDTYGREWLLLLLFVGFFCFFIFYSLLAAG